MKDEQIKHLEFIQSVVTRMNSNSFQIKGWAITIVSALLALYASNGNVAFIFVAIAPTILFWFLDSYYLQQERKFRGVYNDVVKNDGSVALFKMPIQNYTEGSYSFCCVFWSKSIAWLYGIICIALLMGGLIIKYKDCITFNC